MKPPVFWNLPREQNSLFATMLSPLSWLAIWAGRKRQSGGAHNQLRIPVISVGNINLGGSGKTPTVIELVGRLAGMGKQAHIVTRGYGGSVQGPVQVAPTHSADDVGDEPILLSAFAPTWVAKDRGAGGSMAAAAGADVIVLDDGLQNPALSKDLSITVVDADIGFGNGRVAPAGPLREQISDGLARTDFVISIGNEPAQKKLSQSWPELAGTPRIHGRIEPLQTGMDWRGLRILAFAGIGRPEKFYDTLTALGADVVARRSFGDHQKLPHAILTRLASQAHSLSAQLVTTEKDAARLPKEWQQQVLTLPVRLVLEEGAELDEAIDAIFESKGANP